MSLPPSGPRILVVDDMPANAQLLVRMLTGRGYRAYSVSSGADALESTRQDPPDLILLDINMPGMDGFEVCRRLKADASVSDIPVLFISALHEIGDKVKALGLGGVDYVTKPFQLEEVFARIETHLKLRQLQRQLALQNQQLEQLVAERTRELQAAYARVQDLSKIQGDFLSMISHEMRTPTHGLLGLGELLMRLCPPSEARTRYAGLLERSQSRLLGLFNDVALIAEIDVFAREQALRGCRGAGADAGGSAGPALCARRHGRTVRCAAGGHQCPVCACLDNRPATGRGVFPRPACATPDRQCPGRVPVPAPGT